MQTKRPLKTILTAKQQKEVRDKAAAGARLKDLMREYRIGCSKLYALLRTMPKPTPRAKNQKQPPVVLRETFGGAQAAPTSPTARPQTAHLKVQPKAEPPRPPQSRPFLHQNRVLQYESEIARLKGLVVELAQDKSDLGSECQTLKGQLASVYRAQATGRI